MAEILRPDVCVVGAGALGLALAKHARQLGAEVVLVDRGQEEPGDGPDQALRLSALKTSAALAHAFRHGAELGLVNADPKPSLRAIQERMGKIAAARAPADSPERLRALGIETVTGTPRFSNAQTLLVDEQPIRAGATILALGAEPQLPPIPGLDEIEIFTLDSILEASRKLSHLLVIGDDPAAYVMAQSFARLGSAVTLVPQGEALRGFDREAVAILLRALASDNVRVIESASVAAIHPRSQGIGATVTLATGASEGLDISHVLVAAGATTDLGSLDLAAARLRPQRHAGGLVHGEMGQTSNRRIRLVGPAAGIDQWTHALRHGRAVVESLVLGQPRHKLGAQPRLIATEPALAEIGQIGGKADAIWRASFAENDQAIATGRTLGMAKVRTGGKGNILGASIIGAEAGELAAVLGLAMERALPLDALSDLSLPHPSLFSIITALGDNFLASRPASAWAARRRAVRRVIPF